MLNAILMIGTRILFAMGRDRLLWHRAAAVNRGGTPGVAMLVTTAVAVALIATGTFQRLVAIVSIFLAVNYAICCVALIASVCGFGVTVMLLRAPVVTVTVAEAASMPTLAVTVFV